MSSGALTQRAIGSLLILPVAAVALFPPVGTLAVTVLLIALAAREAAKILTKVLGGASAFWITVILISPLFAAITPRPTGEIHFTAPDPTGSTGNVHRI